MNNLLRLQGAFHHLASTNKPSARNIPKQKVVPFSKIEKLISELEYLKSYWSHGGKVGFLKGALINVNYINVVSKSNRIKMLLTSKQNHYDNISSVRGAKFNNDSLTITHFVSLTDVEETIVLLNNVLKILNYFVKQNPISGSVVTHEFLKSVTEGKNKIPSGFGISKSRFTDTVVDCYYVDSFSVVDKIVALDEESSKVGSNYKIVTLYTVGAGVEEILRNFKIEGDYKILKPVDNNETTELDSKNIILLVTPSVLNEIQEKAPFLVSMSCTCDLGDIKSLPDLDLISNINNILTDIKLSKEKTDEFDDPVKNIYSEKFESNYDTEGSSKELNHTANGDINFDYAHDELLQDSLQNHYGSFDLEKLKQVQEGKNNFIQDPTIEPCIGVIDTSFDQNVYFSKWVEYHDLIDPKVPDEDKNFEHGTEVDSIIVDGPRLNPDLEDGLGHFRVKHFALASKNNRTFEIILNISDIVSQNQDIKVWNLSLGSDFEIDDNYISVLGSILDSLQTKYDVIFVIAGTNRAKTRLTHNTILTRAHEIDKDLAKVESNDTDVIFDDNNQNNESDGKSNSTFGDSIQDEIANFSVSYQSNQKNINNEVDCFGCDYKNIAISAETLNCISLNQQDNDSLYKIGSPADSINSIVVNSVKRNNKPASYTRVGPVLSFFVKPDVSYYGGDLDEPLVVCGTNKDGLYCIKKRYGTSFAAPWIARKVAFLIYILGMTREEAKALIIDAAYNEAFVSNCQNKTSDSDYLGHGVVPIHIDKLIKTENDEIKVVMHQKIDQYENFNYRFPVPISNKKQNFIARATLCYSPYCSRAQGVDYTCTELDLHFGRMKPDKNGKTKVDSVNSNTQADKDGAKCSEKNARTIYRKWDNVKIVSDVIKTGFRPRKLYTEDGMWGIMVRSKERLNKKLGQGMNYALVITLKEMSGFNRIGDFIKSCQLNGWMVNEIRVDNHHDIFTIAQQKVNLD